MNGRVAFLVIASLGATIVMLGFSLWSLQQEFDRSVDQSIQLADVTQSLLKQRNEAINYLHKCVEQAKP